ncbi:hypothetical protein NDU88_004961 [Pleurodeles waltl]|uniref:coagulation factor Xa n=1 Tax=Pleurodeles waltl TaxID=8319 RepID=A0AAV7NP56_PLEWA|nr:hypothetical protein NDU88_004961 [Pleurodeles waltl]
MAGLFSFLALLTFSAVLLQAEENVFIKKQHATEILLRKKRANSGLEEFKKGNLERECMEERCSYEEAREVFENDDATRQFWNKYQDGDQCESVHCNYGGSCVDGIGEYTCLCLEGYEGKNCEIVTPQLCSLDNGGCEQFCKPVERSVKCSCATGYILGEDQKSCVPTGAFPCGKRLAIRRKRSVTPDEHNAIVSKKGSKIEVEKQNITAYDTAAAYYSDVEEDSDATDVDTRIVGGRACSPGECPWQALLVNENQEGFCGGTILNEYFILTAAHCMNQSKYFEVVVGEVDTKKKEGTESVHKVGRIITHQKFVLQTYDYDIALLRLKEPINFTKYVIPVCIPEVDFADDVLMAQETATVSGFGVLHQRGQQATKLQVLQVPYIDRQQCIESSTFAITKNMFCAGYDTEVKDACQGDSGGPHVTPYRDTFFVTGIVSWGEGCAQKGKYGVYTKVSKFYKWIRAAMKVKS